MSGLLSGDFFDAVDLITLVPLSHFQSCVGIRAIIERLRYVNQVGTAFCQTQFDDSDVQALMTEVYTPNPIFAVQIVNRMYKLLLTNEMAESIMVYNGRTGAAYSTLPIKNREYSELLALLQNDTSGEALSVRPRQVYNDVKKAYDHRVLTYILAERDYATNQILSAVVVNVSTEWMLANLSDVQADKNNRMVLMSQDGTILLDSARSLPGINEKLDDALYKKNQSTDKSFYWQIDGKRQVVSSRMVNGSDWRLVVIQPYAAMGAFVGKIRTQVMLMVLFSLLLSVPLTLGIAQLIYRPVGTLFAHVARAGNAPVDPPQNAHAEVEYLRGVFDRQNDRLQQLENY